jgi:CRP-like cAMP-binding protein
MTSSPTTAFAVTPASAYRNRLLGALATDDLAALEPHLESVPLPLHTVLLQPNEPIEHVHFLESGLASDVAMTGDKPVECGLIGHDGLVGCPILLGTDRGIHESLMQVGGEGFRIQSGVLQRLLDEHATLRHFLLKAMHVFAAQTAQTAACNARHSIEVRLARWLLMAHDRMTDDLVPLTHDYLAVMLGVRRAGVTVALHQLEGEGLVRAGRGQILIKDRRRLEVRACACYDIVRRETDRVLGLRLRRSPA